MTVASIHDERRNRRSFTASDVCAIASITYRQCDYWTRTGLVTASGHPSAGSGDNRWYRDSDVLRISVVAALVRAGVSLATIREHLDNLLEHPEIYTGDVTITVHLEKLQRRIENYRRAAS